MNRVGLILAASTVISLSAISGASAQDSAPTHNNVGAGFHSVEAPLGLRMWMSGQRVAIDLGLGIGSDPAGIDPDESEKNYTLEVGVPFVWKSWDRAHALFRPGILYHVQQIGIDGDGTTPGLQYDTENQTTFDLLLELEAELFIVDNVSVSAAHGFGFRSFDPGFGGDSQSSWGTRGSNFTTIGFHAYVF